MGAPLEITRTDYTAEELRGLCGRCSDGAQVRRILALALVLEGRSRTEAAELNGMDRQVRIPTMPPTHSEMMALIVPG